MRSIKTFNIILLLISGLFSERILAQEMNITAKQVINYSIPSNWNIQLPKENTLSGYLGLRYLDNLNNRLLKVDEDALLDGFLHRPGKHRWIGEHVGKYLESAANTWAITKNPDLKKQMDRMANTLISTQLPDGYLGTYIPQEYWTSWDVWSHKYDLVGLLAYYRETGNLTALNASKRVGDLLCRTFGDNLGQRDIIKSGTHVGMAATSVLDPMVDLFLWTGDKKYLNFCQYIIGSFDHPDGPAIIKSLLKDKRVDKVANGKAYEMLSNLVGILKLYRVTGDEPLLKAPKIAFDDIVSRRLYISGTTSDHERFKNDFLLQADTAAHMGEGCVTVTWMQFNMQLFSITGDLKYFNEIEKSLYNQLLAAQNPESGCVSYYTPLIGVKPYRCHITCCLSSVPRGIALIPYLNYGKVKNIPTILLYESAKIKDTITTMNNAQLPIELNIESQFPEIGLATIELKLSHESTFELLLRVPYWARSFKASINGQNYKIGADGFIMIKRKWNVLNKIKVSFEMPATIIPGGQSYPGFIAIKRGPQVLSFDASLNTATSSIGKIPYPIGLKLVNSTKKLPSDWEGTQSYNLSIPKSKGTSNSLTLVPYAEASKTGGTATVWIPIEEK